MDLLKPKGRMVTIAADSEGTKDERIEKAFFIVEPDGKQLAEIGKLLDSGELHACVDAAVPFSLASNAYCGTVKNRNGRGKLVLSMGEQETLRAEVNIFLRHCEERSEVAIHRTG